VIDWVLDVGRALNALSFLSNSKEYFAAAGHQLDVTRIVNMSGLSAKAGYTATSFQSGEFTATLTKRTPTQVSIIPQIDERLDVPKVLDLVALFFSALRR
jgi:hypothetical protein